MRPDGSCGNGKTWGVVYKVEDAKILILTVTVKEPAWETLKNGNSSTGAS